MNQLVLPIIIPFLLACLLLIWRKPTTTRRILVATLFTAVLGCSLFILNHTLQGHRLVLPFGGWAAPYGIVLTVDILSAIMTSLSSFVGLCCLLYGYAKIPLQSENPLRLPLFSFMLAGIHMSFATGDLFNLYVSFEVMLIASYALMTLESDNYHIKQNFNYVTINLVASTFFILGAALTYGYLGTLNFAHIAHLTQNLGSDPKLIWISLFLFLAFALKAGMFPLYYWLPKSYPTMPPATLAFYGGLLTKVGIYTLIRLLVTILPHDILYLHETLYYMSLLTMILGVLGAVSKRFIRAILSYHILSQVGFITLALSLFTPIGLTACLVYIIHHIVVKASLFLIGGTAQSVNQTDTLKDMGGLWKATPFLGVLFLFQAFSLAGIPPLSGFWGKYLIIVGALEINQPLAVIVCVIASILTLVSMLKIWMGSFWKAKPEGTPLNLHNLKKMMLPISLMVLVSLSIGLGMEQVVQISQKATAQLLNKTSYIQEVMKP